MPPLYRMPIVYLTVGLLTLAYAAGTWTREALRARGAAQSRPSVEALGPTIPAVADAESAPAETADPPPGDGILRTADGLRRKVLVRELELAVRPEPEARPTGPRLDYFSIRFVYGESPPDAPTMLQVGLRDGTPQGWVPVESVLEWDTRLMARPTERSGRPPLRIYREESCLLDALAGRRCPRHAPHACPTEGEEAADFPAGSAAEGPVLGLPILASKSIPQPGGSVRTVHEVVSLVRDRAPVATASRELPPDFLPSLRRIYVAFAIDTTASMQATIESARALAADLAAEATERHRDVTLRLALVEYRDASPAFGFRIRPVTGFTDPVGFRAALGRIEAAGRGDGSVAEAVLDGVAAALPRPDDEPVGQAPHLAWPTGRAGELATKMLVLLGDAPDHAPDAGRAARLADLANRAGITVAAVALEPPFSLSRDERRRRDLQWLALAEGSFRPLDKASGFARPVAPLVVAPDQADQLTARLQALIDDRVEHARELAALAAAEAEGRLTEYVDSRGLTLDRVAPVLVDLHRNDPEPVARPDPRLNGRKAPSVRRGWLAERVGGEQMVRVEVLMSRDELDLLIAELGALQRAVQGGARDLSDLLRIGTAAASGETSFLAVDRGGRTFAEHLRRRQGLPPAREDSLLRRSQADLLQADDLYRAALDARLSAGLRQLIARRNAVAWDDPAQTVDGMATVPYEAIDF